MTFSKPGIWLSIMSRFFFVTMLMVATVEIGESQGFHSGGVGHCEGCHAIHTVNNQSQVLLLNTDPSSICLNCHSGLGGPNSPSVFSPDGSALTPGGDFYWLTRSFSWLDGSSPGNEHGHNVVAADYNLTADPVLKRAPGGNYPSAQLGCTSCHDPHGLVAGGIVEGGLPVSGSGTYGDSASAGTVRGNYRLLGDSRYQPPGGASFVNDSPVARQSSVNKFEESDISHVDYGKGMSEWCGNCHAAMLDSEHRAGGSAFRHPSGGDEQFDEELVNLYNSYVRTGDFNGTAATAYLQFVPFERGTDNLQLLDPASRLGPDVNANVMCLTCHRAHASAFPSAGRWDFAAGLLSQSHPALGDIGATASDVVNSYYGRDITAEFGSQQSQFCEKCHGP